VGPGRILSGLAPRASDSVAHSLGAARQRKRPRWARLLGETLKAELNALSAVDAGVKDVREAVAKAAERRDQFGARTLLFIDEIHRFSKTQQDALLPHVEARHRHADRRDPPRIRASAWLPRCCRAAGWCASRRSRMRA